VKKDVSLDLKRATALSNFQRKPADLRMSQKVTLNQPLNVEILHHKNTQYPIEERGVATLNQ
jgi:hypothetical protein